MLKIIHAASTAATRRQNKVMSAGHLPDGSREYIIACGAGLGWNICHRRANELCPTGYNTLSQDGGFNRKELTIACPDRPAASVQSAYAQCTYEVSIATVSLQRDREASQDRLFRQCMAARATRTDPGPP